MSTVVIPLTDMKEWLDPNVVKAVLGTQRVMCYIFPGRRFLIPRGWGDAESL